MIEDEALIEVPLLVLALGYLLVYALVNQATVYGHITHLYAETRLAG